MDELILIGIGTGCPDHMTREGEAAMRDADLILIPRKGADKDDLAELRRGICRDVLGNAAPIVEFDMPLRDVSGDYQTGVRDWHDAIAAAWMAALAGRDARKVALLVWGDPSLYDSTLRIADRIVPMPKMRVVPGITALQALTAAHRIPLNDINAPVMMTTGRRLRDNGWPVGAVTVAVMLDSELSFRGLELPDLHIWWGAYLGMENQIIVAGLVTEIADTIIARRAEAREAHGWIMDTYLLKRVSPI